MAMQKLWSLVALVAVLAVGTSSLAVEDKKEDKLKGVKCPVSGQDVQEDKTVDYRDAKVYMCCGGCPDAFKKDKAKFATKANHQLVQTKQAKQEKCPLSGGKLNPETKISVAGVDVCFCCNNCKGKVEKAEGDEKLALVFADAAFDKGFKVEKKK
jgi:hypothetical protein